MNRRIAGQNQFVHGFACVGSLLIVAMALAGSAQAQAPVVPAGSGTEADPHQISQLGHLVWMGDNAGSSSGKFYTLQSDIDASATTNWNGGDGFTPIGTNVATRFLGSFNGNGKVIRNLSITRPGKYYVGLFGYMGSSGVVTNLGVEGGFITGSSNVGGLVGQNDGTVIGCYASVSVTGSAGEAGGLVGWNDSGTVSNCYATGPVTGASSCVGGLMGYNDGGTVSGCYATGPVTCTAPCVGGLVGYNDLGTVRGCYASGAVTGSDEIGGLVGCNDRGAVSGCYATGAVTGSGDRIGGLVGRSAGVGTLSQCYATGLVTGNSDVGGLVGSLDSTGAVSDCYAAGFVTGNANVGGLVGYNPGGTVGRSYWDMQTSGQATSVGGTGMNTAAMKRQATFAGWDFVSVWAIMESVTYPYMLWAAAPPPPSVPVPGPGPAPEPYICAPAGDAALSTVGSYDGYFYHAGAFGGGSATAVRGTLTLKITNLAGKLTAQAVLQKVTLGFSAKAWGTPAADGTQRATLMAKGGETLELYVRQNRVWGRLSGGTLGNDVFTLDGARNRFVDRKDTVAQTVLNRFRGYYTVALPVAGTLSLGAANAAPEGSGYLTLTIGNSGSAKIAGVLADGTKVSQSSRLILFDGCGPEACVPLFAPLYAKKGWAGGLLWIDPANRTAVTDRDLGWFVRWEKPGAGSDGFSELLDACGGYYGTSAALAAEYLLRADVGGVRYHTGAGVVGAAGSALVEGITVTASGNRLVIAKGAAPVLTEGGYDYSGANSALGTLAFAPATGIFKGKFNLYFDYGPSGTLTHKAVSVPYAGVLTPLRSAVFAAEPAGQGHCLVPDNDPAVKAYRLSRSYKIELDAAPH